MGRARFLNKVSVIRCRLIGNAPVWPGRSFFNLCIDYSRLGETNTQVGGDCFWELSYCFYLVSASSCALVPCGGVDSGRTAICGSRRGGRVVVPDRERQSGWHPAKREYGSGFQPSEVGMA